MPFSFPNSWYNRKIIFWHGKRHDFYNLQGNWAQMAKHTGRTIITLKQEQMPQNLSLCPGYVPLSIWCGSARWAPWRLYCDGHSQPLQAGQRLQCPSSHGLGCFLVCQLSSTLWTQVMTQQTLQLKNIATFSVRLTPLAFLTIGTVRSIRPIQTITSGPSGFLPSFMKKAGLWSWSAC